MVENEHVSGGSILDRVLSQKQTQEIEHFNPVEVVTSLLKTLPTREEDILRRRHGLNEHEPQTLEMIGDQYKITRERVRQIASGAITKLKKLPDINRRILPVTDAIVAVLNQHGGTMREETFLHHLLGVNEKHPSYRSATLFLMEYLLSDRCKFVEPTNEFAKSWQLVTAPVHLISDTIQEAYKILEQNRQPMKIDELISKVIKTNFGQTNRFQLSDEAVASYIDISVKLAKNPYDEYGLAEWGSIIPKRMNDKIYLILKKSGKPLHFNEITRLINEIKFDHRMAYAPTVHNELILNDQYVLIGRGIYALKEWGYKPGIVSDILQSILSKAGRPMTRDELVTEVLKQRMVKRNTIHLALTNRKIYNKLPTGEYTLA